MKRRHFLLGTAVVAGAVAWWKKPADAGAPYDDYFRKLNAELKKNGPMRPCMLIDLDRLKPINDQYGHPMGDEVLKVVSSTVRSAVIEPCFFGRLGGEEFLIVLPRTDLRASRIAAERFREAIMSIDTSRWLPDRRRITASIGCAVSSPAADTPSTMLKRADSALYAAKRSGRNCVRTEPASPPDSPTDVNSLAAQA